MTHLNAEAAADTIYRVLMSDEFQQFMLLEAPAIAQRNKDEQLARYQRYPQALLDRLTARPPSLLMVASLHISDLTYMSESIVRQMLVMMREQELIDEQCLLVGDPRPLPLWPGATLTIMRVGESGNQEAMDS